MKTKIKRGMDMFCDFVNRQELIDIPIVGVRFTWSNFQENPALSKLDCFLVSVEWEEHLFSLCSFPRTASDHNIIMLKGGGKKGGQALNHFVSKICGCCSRASMI